MNQSTQILTPSFSQKTKTFFVFVLVGFVVYSALFFRFGNLFEISSDTRFFYIPAAIQILEEKTYGIEGVFSYRYPPLYSMFLAFIFKITGQMEVQNELYPYVIILIQSSSVGLLYLIAAEFVSARAAILAGALLLTYPFFAVMATTKMMWTAMPLFLFLFLLSLLFLIKAQQKSTGIHGALSGFFLGLSHLVWPAVFYLWIPLGFLLWVKAKKMRLLVLFILGFWIPVGLWGLTVQKHTGELHFTSSGFMLSVRDGLLREDGQKFDSFQFVQEAKKQRQQGGLGNPSEVAAFAVEQVVKRPSDSIRFLIYKFFRPWYATDSERYEKEILRVQTLYLLLALAGGILHARRYPAQMLLILTLVAYFWLIAFSVLSILRYMIPVMALLMILVAVFGDSIFGLIKGSREGNRS